MKRPIKKEAVVGSGIMGSGIACHFANIGCEVVLLDIVPRELTEADQKKGLTTDSKHFRNKIVNEALDFALKSNPSPIYRKSFATRIVTGNFDDNTYLRNFEITNDIYSLDGLGNHPVRHIPWPNQTVKIRECPLASHPVDGRSGCHSAAYQQLPG